MIPLRFSSSQHNLPAQMPYFNETHSADGRIRPHYAEVFAHWQSMPEEKRRALHLRSKRLFSGDYAQDALPRILTQGEFSFLQKGVEQRARAIIAFLRDYCTSGTRWKRVMPSHVLHSTIARHHRGQTLKNSNPDRLAFPYGPDIIRDRSGKWRIIEDSAGILGGIGDLVHSHKILYQLVPKFRRVLTQTPEGVAGINDPLDYFKELAQYFSQKAAQNGGIPLLYLREFTDEPDRETQRLAQCFARFGIEFATASDPAKKLVIKEGAKAGAGIYLKQKNKTTRVGALITRDNPELFDGRTITLDLQKFLSAKNSDDSVYLRDITRSFETALKTPSLKSALLQGQAWTNFSPGIRFVNDKIFGLFVDSMIRGFLKEEPLLKCIPARRLSVRTRERGWQIDRQVLSDLRRNKDKYVIKQVDEDGGSGVWIGQKESKASVQKLIDERLRKEPEKYIVQKFEHLSVLENRIVDLRLHAHVDCERILVSNTPWGRANWISGDGKVNISSKGFTSPVMVMGQSDLK